METTHLPKDLPEAMLVLDEILSEEDKNTIRSFAEWEASIRMHFTLGHWIRNQWIHNRDSPLREVFKNMHIFHEDDKSSLILTLYHRHLSGVELNWEEELADLDPYERIKRRREKGI